MSNEVSKRINRRELNILYIMTDEQPVSCVARFGNPVIKTPNLDQLSKKGCKLEKTYIASFPCCASRASQLTGRYLHNHNVFGNDIAIDETIPSLGTICKSAGYTTGYFGKWHLGGFMYKGHKNPGKPAEFYCERLEKDEGWGKKIVEGGKGEDYPQCGFTSWAGGWKQYHQWLKDSGRGNLLDQFFPKGAKFGGHVIAPATSDAKHNYSQVPEDYHVEAFAAGQACDFIKENADSSKPWCSVLSFYGPHSPVAPPKPWDEMYSLDQVTLPANHRDELVDKPMPQQKDPKHVLNRWTDDQFKDYIRRYWGFCSYIDKQIGRIFDTLRQTGQWDNTIILFTSDHGDMVGAHGFYLKSGNNGYDELFRVPTIVKVPGITTDGSSSKSLVSHVDLLPTLLEAAGIDTPKGVDGKSMIAHLKDTSKKHRDFVFSDSCNRSIICCDDEYKFVLHWAAKGDDNELYDLKNDSTELWNLSSKPEKKPVVDKMTNRIMDWLDETGHKYKNTIAKKAGIH